jgi:Tol biopolymer transport system component
MHQLGASRALGHPAGMRTTRLLVLLLILAPLGACGEGEPVSKPADDAPAAKPAATSVAVAREPEEREKHFRNLRQLTFSGENAEAYWSFDEKHLIFQSRPNTEAADQIYIMDAEGGNRRLVSKDAGRTTCSYFLPGDERILYGTTHLADKAPPPMPEYDPRKLGYVWAIFNNYAIVSAKADGSDVKVLQDAPGYDAEATVSPTGDRIVFTSTRDGDLDLYSMAIDGSDVKRLTSAVGYDGGAFFSWDGKKIVWRAPNPEQVDKEETKALLARELVRPNKLEIWIMDADGSNKKMLTRDGCASFGPFWHPDGKRIIYSSNRHDPKGGNFELYLLHVDTLEIERVTYFERKRPGQRRSDDFDGFPMFTRDGKKLVFCSNRHNDKPNETNVFVVDWVD